MDERDYKAMNEREILKAMNEREILIEDALMFYDKVVNQLRPDIIFIITNETDGTVFSAFYKADTAVAKCKLLKVANPSKQYWVTEIDIK